MERIVVEIAWNAPDGTLDDLENEGGDVTLVEAALARVRDDDFVFVTASRESV
jgi:membrane protein involved in colicin uptake